MNENKETKNFIAEKSASVKRMGPKSRRAFNTIFILIVVLVFVGINILSMTLVDRFPNLAKDFTSTDSYSLQKVTDEYFNYMDRELTVKVLISEDTVESVNSDYGYQINLLLKKMDTYDKVNVERLEIASTALRSMQERYPDIDWTDPANFIIVEDEATGRYKGVGLYDVFSAQLDSSGETVVYGQRLEQAVLSAMQYVTTEEVLTVAFSVGNGEVFNSKHSDYNYYGAYVKYLYETNGYEVKDINLLTETPDEAIDIIIMAAPTADLSNEESEKLTTWLDNNGNFGKTFVYIPNDLAEKTDNIDLILKQWDMQITDGYIYENELQRLYNGFADFSTMSYYDDTYTENLKNNTLPVLMPQCMPVEILNEDTVKPLLESSTMADVKLFGKDNNFINSDGTALTAAAISYKSNEDGINSNVMVWGSLSALYTEYLYNNNTINDEYYVNLFNTLYNKSEPIVVEGAAVGVDEIMVSTADQITVGIIFIFVVPVAVMVVGIVVWVRRRNR